MPFAWSVALRYLKESRLQTLLILTGIGVGVGVIVFLSSLIGGLQESLIARTLGSQAHIVLRPPDEMPRILKPPQGDGLLAPQIEKPAQRPQSIVAWQGLEQDLAQTPGITAVAPTVAGAAFALRGPASRSIAVRGIQPESYRRIVDLEGFLSEGQAILESNETIIGIELARELGLGIGDKLRVLTAENRGGTFQIRGILDLGNKDLNLRWVFVSLRSGQTLFDLKGGVSTLEIKVADIFRAQEIAQGLAARTGLEADSWMKLNAQLLVGLRSQSSSSVMIQAFVILAVALGIASVLGVSVVQKSREIGILRAFGTSRRAILQIFLLQGGMLGLLGSILGILIGVGLSLFFASLATNPDGTPTFPVQMDLWLYLRSTLIAIGTGIGAALIPARRAAHMDPVEVIRYG